MESVSKNEEILFWSWEGQSSGVWHSYGEKVVNLKI